MAVFLNQELQFTTAKQFADYISNRYGRSGVIRINKEDGATRLRRLTRTIGYRTSDSREEGGLDRAYDQAVYGLNWVIASGRVNHYVVKAVHSMNLRQLCELIHDLKMYTHNVGDYARYLMAKFPPTDL